MEILLSASSHREVLAAHDIAYLEELDDGLAVLADELLALRHERSIDELEVILALENHMSSRVPLCLRLLCLSHFATMLCTNVTNTADRTACVLILRRRRACSSHVDAQFSYDIVPVSPD